MKGMQLHLGIVSLWMLVMSENSESTFSVITFILAAVALIMSTYYMFKAREGK